MQYFFAECLNAPQPVTASSFQVLAFLSGATVEKPSDRLEAETPHAVASFGAHAAGSVCGDQLEKKGCLGGSPFLQMVANPLSSKTPQSR